MSRAFGGKKPRRALRLILPLVLLPLLSGCTGTVTANYREVGTLQPVQTLGFDDDGGNISMTISTGSGLEGQDAVLISRSAETILACMTDIQDYSSKNELYFPQTRFILLGEDMTRTSLGSLVGFLERSNLLRLDTLVYVVKNGSAKDLIVNSGKKDFDISESLATIQHDVENRGESEVFSCSEIMRALAQCGGALICAVEAAPLEGSVFSEAGDVTAVPCGYAVIKDYRLCAYIARDDCTLGANILINKSANGHVTLEDEEGGKATLTLDRTKTEYSAVWDGTTIKKLTADVSIVAQLVSTGDLSGNPSPEYIELMRARLAAETKDRCKRVLELSRVLRCDFLWLKGTLRHKYPKKFCGMTEDFTSVFAGAETEVNVSVQIVRTFIEEADDPGKAG